MNKQELIDSLNRINETVKFRVIPSFNPCDSKDELIVDHLATACAKVEEHIKDLENDRYFDRNSESEIALIWSIEDVQDLRKDLTYSEAVKVLKYVEDNHSADDGVNWETLKDAASELFPEAPKPSGPWHEGNQHPDYPLEDWMYEVYNQNTTQGYNYWVNSSIERDRRLLCPGIK